jgi:hypothetical protein
MKGRYNFGLDGRNILRWTFKTKCKDVGWSCFDQDMVQWWNLAIIMDLQVS